MPISRPWDLNLANLTVLQTHLHSGAPPGVANWACVQSPGVNPRGTMCLLGDLVLGVQVQREKPLQEAAACSFFGGGWPWSGRCTSLCCGSYSHWQVANEGSIKIPWRPPLIRTVGRWRCQDSLASGRVKQGPLFTAGLPISWTLGHRLDDVITRSDFKSETMFGFLSPNYMGNILDFLVKPKNGLIWSVFACRLKKVFSREFFVRASKIELNKWAELARTQGTSVNLVCWILFLKKIRHALNYRWYARARYYRAHAN